MTHLTDRQRAFKAATRQLKIAYRSDIYDSRIAYEAFKAVRKEQLVAALDKLAQDYTDESLRLRKEKDQCQD